MRKVFLSSAIVISAILTGCASTPRMSFETARDNCIRAGFKTGTDLFLQCINNQLSQNNKPSFAEQYMMQRAANPRRDVDVICRPWLNCVRCEES